MNDRFKFRAWDKTQKIMVEFDLYDQDCYHLGRLQRAEQPVYEENCEIMQCTGLKDKNGKLIFEGDILQTPLGIFEVFYRDGFAAFYVRQDNWIDLLHNPMEKIGNIEWFEIIGNIYENPELLPSK